MLDTANFKGLGQNTEKWEPNLHWEDVPEEGIYRDSLYRWKKELTSDLINFIEFIVGPDMEYLGYELSQQNEYKNLNWNVYQLHKEEHLRCKGWRTDNHNPEIDLSLEILRHQCLQQKTSDHQLIRRCFLFYELYEDLFQKKRILEI